MLTLACPLVAWSQPPAVQAPAGQSQPRQPQVNAPQEIKLEEAAAFFAPADREVLEKWKAN
ncbi:MAG: hypothetical protein ACKOJF_21135, partial [Planctomycetaceae bacterium]